MSRGCPDEPLDAASLYSDRAGLVALWREALLANQVLAGQIRGYRTHPQLARLRSHPHPNAAIGVYLEAVADEALRRNYRFDRAKFEVEAPNIPATGVTDGQVLFERADLVSKLARREPVALKRLEQTPLLQPHLCLRIIRDPTRTGNGRGLIIPVQWALKCQAVHEASQTALLAAGSIGQRLKVHDLNDVEAVAVTKLDGLESNSR